MSEVKCVATRDSYGTALKELAAEGADNLVVLDADLSAATKTGIFEPPYQLRYCRGKYGLRCSRLKHNGSCSVCVKLCNVCSGQSL